MPMDEWEIHPDDLSPAQREVADLIGFENYLKEYARLWDKLTEPVEFHEVTVPDEDGDYTFTAYFSNVGDELLRKKAEKNYWKNLTANFIAQKPART